MSCFFCSQTGVRLELEGHGCLEKHLFFNVSFLQPLEQLSLAQLEIKFLWDVFRTPRFLLGPQALSVSLYKVLRVTLRGTSHDAHRRLVLSQSVQLEPEAGSLTLDLTALAENWRKPGHNYGLVLELQPHPGDGHLHGPEPGRTRPVRADRNPPRVPYLPGGCIPESTPVPLSAEEERRLPAGYTQQRV